LWLVPYNTCRTPRKGNDRFLRVQSRTRPVVV